MQNQNSSSATFARFAANLQYEDIPVHVISRIQEMFVDWVGSAVVGKSARPVQTIELFAEQMGEAGLSEVLISRRRTTPLFAAMVNAAASHFIEQDDVHNGSVFHPAAVVFPPVLAVAQALGSSGRDILVVAVAGYEAGIRVGEFLGRSHYKIFHATDTAGTVAAAVGVGRLLQLNPEQMLDVIGSGGIQATGLWEFLVDADDSKQLHTAHAAISGLLAAYLAKNDFKGANQILEGTKGMGVGMSTDSDPKKPTDCLMTCWAISEVSFKYHTSCQHTHAAADALLKVVAEHWLKPEQIASVQTLVHQNAIDVLGSVVDPCNVHQAKFSMGTVLGLAALYSSASVSDFETAFKAPDVVDFRNKVTIQLNREVDEAYPARWIGKVTVTTSDSRALSGRVEQPKGDPGNTLSRQEIEAKAHRLATFSASAIPSEMADFFATIWNMTEEVTPSYLLPEAIAA